jgi:hypothetical protein
MNSFALVTARTAPTADNEAPFVRVRFGSGCSRFRVRRVNDGYWAVFDKETMVFRLVGLDPEKPLDFRMTIHQVCRQKQSFEFIATWLMV